MCVLPDGDGREESQQVSQTTGVSDAPLRSTPSEPVTPAAASVLVVRASLVVAGSRESYDAGGDPGRPSRWRRCDNTFRAATIAAPVVSNIGGR